MTFDAAVDISGNPQLELDFNGTAKAAACATGTNTTTMACSYTVAVGDSAPNGVGIAANKLTGGTITATGSTTNTADLDHSVVSIHTGHKVDGIRPTLVTTGSDAPTTSADGTQVILTFSEALSSADASKFTVAVTTSGSIVSNTGTAATFSGSQVTVTHTGVVSLTSTVSVALSQQAVADLAGNSNPSTSATTVTKALVPVAGPTPLSCDATDAAITGTVQALESGGNTEVTDVTNLVADCTTLLRLKDELQGTVSLNWDPAIQMWSQLTTGVDWDGIRVSATSHRVIELILPNEGLDGDIPAALANLGGLITLDLRNNPLGDDVTNLNLPTTLTILSLSYTGLTGTIPAALSQLTELTFLELNNNELTGPIPDLSQLTELDRVYLSNNQLSGQIPSLSQLAEMRILDLSNNQLTGQIPPLSGLAALEELFLWNNQLTGPIPASLNELTTLITLSLSLNQLSGPIPDLSNLDNLEIMYLRNNQLTGPIPASLGDLDALTALSLRNNQLSGPIPAALGGLDALTYLWLSSNPLTGPIPATWGDADPDNDPNTPAPHPFADLLSLHLYDTNWTGTDPTDIQALRDKAGLTLWTNRRPTAPEVTDTPLTPGETFTYTVAFSDRDNDTLTYHATLADGTDLPDTLPSNPAPEDLAFDPATQILSGIPPAAGSIAVTVSVTDEDSPNPPTATDPFCHAARTSTNNPPPLCAYVTVIITPDTRRPPTGPSIPAQVATRERAFSYTVPEFDDPDGPAVIYQASQADGSVLPAWLAFNTTTRTFSGTPPTTGRIDIRVTATDTAYPPSTVSVTFPLTVRAPVTRPPGGGGGGGGGGGPRTSAPDAPSNLLAAAGDGQVVLTWDAPEDDGGAAITDYEYRINGSGPWISTGSTETTHTVTGLDNGTPYVFEVRAVNRIGKGGISNRAEAKPDVFTLDFAHFANGEGLTSDLVFVNVGTHPIRPALSFYDKGGNLIAAESVVEITGDLEVTEDGALSIQTAMEPLGELTISTHGQGELVSGSVRVISFGPIGGVLRFDLPDIGVAGVGASPPVRGRRLPGPPPGGRNQHRGRDPQPGIEPGDRAVRIDARGCAARRREYPSSGQRAVVLVYRHGVHCRRYVGLRGVGALRCRGSGDVHNRGPGTGCRQPHLHHPAGASGAPRRRPGGGADLRAFRQRRGHHLRSGVRESIHRAEPSRAHPLSFGHPSAPSRDLFLRHRWPADARPIGGGHHGRSGGHGGRRPDGPDGDGAAGSAHDLDPRSRVAGEWIGAGGRGRAHRRGPALGPPRHRGGRGGSQPTPQRRPLPGAPPGGRNQHRGGGP